jgi:hypothetical protein
MRTLTFIPIVLLVLAGCAQTEKRYSEREVNRFGMQSLIRSRSGSTLQSIAVLEQLRQGSITNAVERLESDLDGDIEQLRTVLRQADVSDSYRSQVQGALTRAEAYRAKYPRATKEQTK